MNSRVAEKVIPADVFETSALRGLLVLQDERP
jgi:hypothetical protein